MPQNFAASGKFHGNISEDMTLGNIFEQVAQNQQYGWLFLKYPQKEVRLYFQGDLVGLVTPPEDKLQFLPEKMYYGGKISEEIYQKVVQTEDPLKALEEMAPEEEVNAILNNICYDEICALFLCYEGYFEFTEQNNTEADVNWQPIGRMFESEGVLIETANRQQEHQHIYQALPELEEILAPANPNIADMYSPDDPVRFILQLACQRSVHEVLYFSYFGEFDTVRILSSLVTEGKLRILTEEELKAYAAEFDTKKQWDKAIIYYRLLLKRNPMDTVSCETLATCYEKTNQPQKMATLYWSLAGSLFNSRNRADHTQAALYLKKFAEISPDSPEGLEARLQIFDMINRQEVDAKEIHYNILKEGRELFQALRYRKEDVRARQILERLLLLAPHDKTLVSQYINVCLDLRDVTSAVVQYENMAKMYERDRNWKELESVYQKIVRLMPSRTDILQKLETVKKHQPGRVAWKYRIIFALIFLALGGGSWLGVKKYVITPQKKLDNGDNSVKTPDPQSLVETIREKQKKIDADVDQLLKKAVKAQEDWDIMAAKTLLEEAKNQGPSEAIFLFSTTVASVDSASLDNSVFPENLRVVFENNKVVLSQDMSVRIKKQNEEWILEDGGEKQSYLIVKEKVGFKFHKNLKAKVEMIFAGVKKYYDEFQGKISSARAKEQNGALSIARQLYLEIWKDSRFVKMPEYATIRLPINMVIAPTNASIKIDGQMMDKKSANVIQCPPNFKQIEISLYGYRSQIFINAFVATTIPEIDKNLPAAPFPDENVTTVSLAKSTLWEANIEDDNKRRVVLVEGEPCYANGILYIAGRNDCIYAFKDIGENQVPQRLWKLKIGRLSSFTTSPCWHNDVLYVGGNDGVFYAIDATKGEIKLQYALKNKPLIHSSPVVAISYRCVIFGATDGNIYAMPLVDATMSNWSPLWAVNTGKKIESSPILIKDRLLVIGSTSRTLYGINLKNKVAIAWQKPLGAAIESSPVADEANIYIGAGNFIYAINQEGKEVWNLKIAHSVEGRLAMGKDAVYAVCSSQRVYAVSKQGEKLWESSEKAWSKDIGIIKASPLFGSKDILYIGTQKNSSQEGGRKEGSLYAISSDGELKWDYQLGVAVFAAPLPIGNYIVLGVDKLYAFLDN